MEKDWLTNRLILLFLPLQHLIVLPTEFFHRRKTHTPLVKILRTTSLTDKVRRHIDRW